MRWRRLTTTMLAVVAVLAWADRDLAEAVLLKPIPVAKKDYSFE